MPNPPTLSIPHITIDAEGKVRIPPDLARITVRFEEIGDNVEHVKATVDSQSAKLIALARDCGMSNADISATHLTVEPNYEWNNAGHQQVRNGMRVGRESTLTLRDLSKFNQLIQGFVEIPIHRLVNVKMDVAARAEAEGQAISNAVDCAHRAASNIAAQMNVTLGKVFSITVHSSRYIGGTASMGPADIDTFIPGYIEIEKTIQAVFAIDHSNGELTA